MAKFRASHKKAKRPCRIIVAPNGVVSVQAPFNEEFRDDFLAAIDSRRRQWDGKRELWMTTPELLPTVVEILQRHFSRIEGLDELMRDEYDVIGVAHGTPIVIVEAVVKAWRKEYHPDRVRADNYKELYPDALSLDEARQMANARLAEIGQALEIIRKEQE